MKNYYNFSSKLFLLFCSFQLISCKSPTLRRPKVMPYSLVIYNVNLFDSKKSEVHVIAISGATIVKLASRGNELDDECHKPCKLLDGRGGILISGFHDSHVHLAAAGLLSDGITLHSSDVPTILNAVRQFARAHPHLPMIRGQGWAFSKFLRRLPSRFDLDSAESERPVILQDAGGHNAWANSAAIELAQIDETTRDPPGGEIRRLPRSKEPSGIFLESAARFMKNRLAPPNRQEIETAILSGQQASLMAGFTSSQGGPVSLEVARIYADLDRQGMIKQKTSLWLDLNVPQSYFTQVVTFAKQLPPSGHVQVTAFKGFVDGGFNTHTGALIRPYADSKKTVAPLLGQEQLNSLVLRANEAGFPVALHALGDQAVHLALNAYEYTRKKLKHKLFNRVEHALLIDSSDLPRFSSLDIVASVQPNLLCDKDRRRNTFVSLLGERRTAEMFPWQKLIGLGAKVIFGTDQMSLDSKAMSPFLGLKCAAEQSQAQPLSTLLENYTVVPAEILPNARRLGRIEIGYVADFLILRSDFAQDFLTFPTKDWIQVRIIDGNQYEPEINWKR